MTRLHQNEVGKVQILKIQDVISFCTEEKVNELADHLAELSLVVTKKSGLLETRESSRVDRECSYSGRSGLGAANYFVNPYRNSTA